MHRCRARPDRVDRRRRGSANSTPIRRYRRLEGEVVGGAELRLRRSSTAEIAYAVHPRLWGQGIATAAARELLRLGFDEHGRHRIFGTCDPRNLASAAVLRKIGMRYEGRMR